MERSNWNRVLNAAKPGHSADPVSAVTKKGKTLLGVEHPIAKWSISAIIDSILSLLLNLGILSI